MTYAERLAEFVKVTGHRPGEMNKRVSVFDDNCLDLATRKVSLEPPAQSAGPGRCNRFTRAAALGDPKPCVLDAGHEGPHGL